MAKVLVLLPHVSPLFETMIGRLRALFGSEISFSDAAPAAEGPIEDAEILLAFTLPAELAVRAHRLKWIQAMGSGTDGIALPKGCEVILTNAAGLNAVPVAEAAFAMMLSGARDLPAVVRDQNARQWRPKPSQLLRGATLGILGSGHIARAVARRANAFEMRVLGFSKAPRPLADFDAVLARDALAAHAAGLDYLLLVTAIDDDAHHLIDAAMLAALKPGALLVNLARGSLVDETALAEALRHGRIRAALDVFEDEPLSPENELWDLPNLLVTPHSAGHRLGYFEELSDLFEENFAHYRAGAYERMRNRLL